MSYEYDKKQTQAKTKNSVEKCEKKVSKSFIPYFFSESFINDTSEIFAKTMVAINVRMTW